MSDATTARSPSPQSDDTQDEWASDPDGSQDSESEIPEVRRYEPTEQPYPSIHRGTLWEYDVEVQPEGGWSAPISHEEYKDGIATMWVDYRCFGRPLSRGPPDVFKLDKLTHVDTRQHHEDISHPPQSESTAVDEGSEATRRYGEYVLSDGSVVRPHKIVFVDCQQASTSPYGDYIAEVQLHCFDEETDAEAAMMSARSQTPTAAGKETTAIPYTIVKDRALVERGYEPKFQLIGNATPIPTVFDRSKPVYTFNDPSYADPDIVYLRNPDDGLFSVWSDDFKDYNNMDSGPYAASQSESHEKLPARVCHFVCEEATSRLSDGFVDWAGGDERPRGEA